MKTDLYMRWTLIWVAGAFVVAACNNSGSQQQNTTELPIDQVGDQPVGQAFEPVLDSTTAELTIQNDSYDFGEVTEGVKVEHEFRFTNTGNSPLIIANVQASCGCTTPEYSKTPIPPGGEGLVKVVFNSEGQLGKQHKVITVTSNATKRNTLLHLRGEVKKQ